MIKGKIEIFALKGKVSYIELKCMFELLLLEVWKARYSQGPF